MRKLTYHYLPGIIDNVINNLIMYKIPLNFDVKSLEGKEVQQIGYASNVITIYFTDGGFIQIMGPFSLIHNNNVVKCNEIYPLNNDYGFLKLLDKKILESKSNEERDELSVKFENDYTLILESNDFYESFFIKFGREEILI
jgi:hypothetical protein